MENTMALNFFHYIPQNAPGFRSTTFFVKYG
jgi:hypothetical protein